MSKVPVSELFGFVGTYVLWDGQAQVKPSYIGEGNILKRVVAHSRDYATPLNGYIAILGKATRAGAKRDAEILETVLLAAAAETRRSPPNNSQAGCLRGIASLFRRHGVIRVNLTTTIGGQIFHFDNLSSFFLISSNDFFNSVSFSSCALNLF